jgi:hypothetical protein
MPLPTPEELALPSWIHKSLWAVLTTAFITEFDSCTNLDLARLRLCSLQTPLQSLDVVLRYTSGLPLRIQSHPAP